jgi:hypothetical protein
LSVRQIAGLKGLGELLELGPLVLVVFLQSIGLIQWVAGRDRGYRHWSTPRIARDALLVASRLPQAFSRAVVPGR